MIFCNLGSGSKGNCTYLRGENRAILIDQGFSLKNLTERMQSANLDPGDVAAIIVSHEHSDHVKGIGVFARHFRVPVFCTEITRRAIPSDIVKNVRIETFTAGDVLEIGDIQLKTFTTPHDAADPIGFVGESGNVRIAVLTDLGTVVESVIQHIYDLDLLFLESNHDMWMLMNGPYPLYLKHRIKGRDGHLSNEQSLDLFKKIKMNGRFRHLILGHLSEINNDPAKVLELFESGIVPKLRDRKISIEIANQHQPGNVHIL
ncbi:MAG: MBL fold metallo-hydrolase [Candidatus Marinimicrobia bacterium]|nr:MBL fold metallo-hydrolase [Candidatus Neomarinimicrobiota bacterium]